MSSIKKIFVVMPALNEEAYIEAAVTAVLDARTKAGRDVAVLVVNDGSTDNTGQVADRLAQEYQGVSVLHNERSRGLSIAFHEGIRRAGNADYLCVIPGDNAFAGDGIARMFAAAGTAELIVSYREDQRQTRTLLRFTLSRVYTKVISLLFGGGLRDYHSMILYPLVRLRSLDLRATGLGYQIEALVRILRQKPTVASVPVRLNTQLRNRSTALRWRSLAILGSTMLDLLVRR